MNEYAFTTAPEWIQAAMVIGEMLRAFAGRGAGTIISLTDEQSEAVHFADIFMDGCSERMASAIVDRVMVPIDRMPYCEDPKCPAAKACHIHKPAACAALGRSWIERGTARATALHDAEALDGAWKVIADLATAAGLDNESGRVLDDLAKAAFEKAREIVTRYPTDEEMRRLAEAKLTKARAALGEIANPGACPDHTDLANIARRALEETSHEADHLR